HPTERETVRGEEEGTESEAALAEVIPEKTEMSTITMARLYEEQGHLKEAVEVYRKILDASSEIEGVKDKLADLERRIDEGRPKRNLLSILELWQKNMQEKIGAEKPSTSPESSGIDPEKIAAFMQKYVKGSHSG
ncbi:MAG: hypothetical protein P8017_04100, partial [Deltaproteobacteria bacterium]